MLDVDLFNKFICLDCKHGFLLSGSTAINLIICPKCKSLNYEYVRKKIETLKPKK